MSKRLGIMGQINICIAADERQEAYGHSNATDDDLARADANFEEAVLNVVRRSSWLAAEKRKWQAEALREASVALRGDESAERGTDKAIYNAIYAGLLLVRADRIEQQEEA